MNTNKSLITGFIITILVIFLIFTTWLIAKPRPIELQGYAEATQIKVSSKVTGRIDSIAVRKGMSINKGDLLYTIESPEVEAKYNQAEAVRAAAEAQKLKAQKGAQTEDIDAAYNTYMKANAALEFAQKSYVRISNLHAQGVVPSQKLDEMEMQLQVAEKTAAAAKAIWEKAKRGTREEDKSAAKAMLEQAEAVISEINSFVNETRIVAPISAEIGNILSERGELSPAGFPVVTLLDLDDIWFIFNIKEDKMPSISMGKKVFAKIPALGYKEIELYISYIAPMADFATWNSTKMSGDFDMKTFEVHARPVEKHENLRPGMSALVNYKSLE